MQTRLTRKLLGCGWALALLCGPVSLAQIDTLTTRYENRTRPNQSGYTNAVTLGLGSSLESVYWRGTPINAWIELTGVTRKPHFQTTIGAPITAQPADTFLGQVIVPPDTANLEIAPTITSPPGGGAAAWIDYAHTLIASGIGVVDVTWTLAGGGTVTKTYTVSFSTSKRPVRLYWTHKRPSTVEDNIVPLQNAGPTIQFSSNYRVDLYSNSTVKVYNETSGEVGNVRLNGTELQAFEGTVGNFLLVYSRFDEVTSRREMLAYEIVDVLEPMSTRLEVDIGGQLRPLSRPFDTDSLFPQVTRGMVDESGNSEIYVYQHMSGPQKNWLWAIRDSVGKPWKIEVYWRAKEELDVLWPFEVDIYEASWNTSKAQLYARDCVSFSSTDTHPEPKIYFNTALSVQAMPYQVPYSHVIVETGDFYTTYGNDGYALMKYTSGDFVWFETLRSVSGANSTVFPRPTCTNAIPDELRPPSVADGAFFYPGWIKTRNMPADPILNPYNINAYQYPSAYVPTNLLNSAIFPVNSGLLEVWWAQASRFNAQPPAGADYVAPLPAPIFIPNFPVRYRACYPVAGTRWDDVPTQIVLASGQGSAGGTLNDREDVTGPGINIPYISMSSQFVAPLSGGVRGSRFTFEVWLNSWMLKSSSFELARFSRPSADQTTTNTLFTLGYNAGNLLINGTNVTVWSEFPAQFNPYAKTNLMDGAWHHFAVTKAEDGTCTYYINGHLAAAFSFPLPEVDFGDDLLCVLDSFTGRFDNIRLWSSARSWKEIVEGRYDNVAKPDSALIAEYLIEPEWNEASDQFAFPLDNYLSDSSGNQNHIPFSGAIFRSIETWGALPKRANGMLFSGGDAELYIQRNRALDGYNPNEEHALLLSGIAYALRCDLNANTPEDMATEQYTSEPFVLVQYTDADTGKTRMKALQVIPENDMYSFAKFMEAGQMVQAPAPLALMQPANWHTFISGPTLQNQQTCFYDRKGWFWAQQAGNSGGHTNYVFDFEYPHQESFDYPGGASPEVGTRIGWMQGYTGRGGAWPARDTADDPLATPINYTFHVLWPQDVPRLYVGDTLTNPKDGLPAIRGQLSAALLYQQSLYHPATSNAGLHASVHLLDPTVARKVAMEEVPSSLKSYRDPHTAMFFFSELSPLLRERLAWNPMAETNQEFQLTGQYRERTDGHNYLLLNVLDGRSYAYATNSAFVTGADHPDWIEALDALPDGSHVVELQDDTTPFDSLALATDGRGAGYVTIAFNNSTNRTLVDPSESVIVSVIKVEPQLYQGRLDPILSANPLDKQMNLKYTADFGGKTERWEFEWQYGNPENGRAPDPDGSGWLALLDNSGKSYADYATIGDAGVFGLSDHYVRCRYRSLDPAVVALVGTNWASYTPPQLAEGWVKRVLKAINPFEQRIRDYMSYALNTELSMVQQAGKPYSGDIPLNQEALNDYGLIPIYETLLVQAKKLSINADFKATESLALALQMAAGRISELYMVLGNEALADAMNPTVDLGSASPVSDFAESSIFCFQNQVRNLLEEELSLLRGRDLSEEYVQTLTQPIEPFSYPLYNRLTWNFTADIMGGEVAYALNYGITDLKGNNDGSINAADAAQLFPQGHGDAYGHYLSAIKGYYYLLRHPNFGWLPQVEGILAGDTEVTISYFHEKRFVMAAAAKARTAEMIVSRTHRDRYIHGESDSWEFAEDDLEGRAWGVDEWATRGHLGAYFDWLTANALLPSRQAGETGIRIIDREGTPELREIADAARRIQRTSDQSDVGLNPLGLADNAIPFDISPAEIDAGKTHFEQIQARALRALGNAAEVFKRVKSAGNALRDQNEARDFDTLVDDEEAAINRRLIEIYGYPYADDIGPGKTYEQDYLGPDLYHYTYVDLYDIDNNLGVSGRYYDIMIDNYSPQNETITGTFQAAIDTSVADYGLLGNVVAGAITFGQDTLEEGADFLRQWIDLETPQLPVAIVDTGSSLTDGSVSYTFNVTGWTNTPMRIRYYVSPSGVPGKPPTYTGQRRAEGEIQIALSGYGQQLFAIQEAQDQAAAAATAVRSQLDTLRAFDYNTLIEVPIGAAESEVAAFYRAARENAEAVAEGIEVLGKIKDFLTNAGVEALPKLVGMANDMTSLGRAALLALRAGLEEALGQQLTEQRTTIANLNNQIDSLDAQMAAAIAAAHQSPERKRMLSEIQESSFLVKAAVARLESALNIANASRMRFAALESEGDQLQVERERLRLQWSSDLNTRRYRNMMYQILRNDELQRYNETFETAARYCYLAARAYDYETGLLASDAVNTAGRDFMTQIVKTRALGRFTLVNGIPTDPLGGGSLGDPGLADVMYRMAANWNVLKGRLGFNNPQNETDVFSLRTEHFRKVPDASGDSAWRGVLQDCWRANLLDMPEFQRFCLPFTPMSAIEPGFAIPFTTTISFRKNFFGQNLAAGDNAFDSTYFATKLRGIGVWFQGYSSNTSTGLANRPQVYVVPSGVDYMRAPIHSTGTDALTRGWQVLDQTLPIPYPLADSQWESPDWSALKNLCGNELWAIRKYPSIRAFHDSGYTESQMSFNARLVGRSVWNSQWWIIIPAGSLHADDETARTRFLNQVKDIKLYLKTYSFSGN